LKARVEESPTPGQRADTRRARPMRRHTEGAMRTNTLRGGLGRGRSAVLIVSLLTIAASGILQALPCFAANADDFTSAEPSHAPGPAPKSDDAGRVRVNGALGQL